MSEKAADHGSHAWQYLVTNPCPAHLLLVLSPLSKSGSRLLVVRISPRTQMVAFDSKWSEPLGQVFPRTFT